LLNEESERLKQRLDKKKAEYDSHRHITSFENNKKKTRVATYENKQKIVTLKIENLK